MKNRQPCIRVKKMNGARSWQLTGPRGKIASFADRVERALFLRPKILHLRWKSILITFMQTNNVPDFFIRGFVA